MGTSCKTRPEAQFPIRLTKAALMGVVVTLADSAAALAHSGDTDSSGGHHCNVGSCAGSYHYHNGGAASPVPRPTGGGSWGASVPWDWLPLLALLGLATWFFWFRPQAQVLRVRWKAERDRLERQKYPHLTAMKELREAERAQPGSGLEPGSEAHTPPPKGPRPSEKERIDEYFRFKGRPGGDAGPGRCR